MMVSLEQLLRVPHVDEGNAFDLSPDGRTVAFSWNGSGTWELYEMQLPNSDRGKSEPRLITRGPGGKFHPRYSPDGRCLAYAFDADGGESFHIMVLDRVSGQHADLTPNITFAHQPNMSWSPDGKQLAILSDAGGQFSLYVLPVQGGGPRLLLDTGHPCWDAEWSLDGKWIAVEVEWHRQERSIFIVHADSGENRQIQENGEVLNAMHPAWSLDGQTLAFSGEPGGWFCIGLYDVESQQIRWLEQAEAEETNPAWSPDGGRLACVRTRGADTSVCVHELSSRETRCYRLGPGIHSHPRFSRDGESLLFLFESPRQPNDLWQLELTSGSFTQLTRSLPEDVDTSGFVIPEEVWYQSFDGTTVPAILYRPHAPSGRALVNIHGGPNWLFQRNWYPFMGYMAAQGWTVLAPNYRGSTGYGRGWAQANFMRLGEVDTWDCAAGAQYLVREKLADAKEIVVSGRSHGGYLTMTCLTEYPELWAGGSAVVPFMNWFTCHQNAREDLQHWDIQNFGDPDANADLWRRRSPFFYLDRIQAGVQLICSANDPRCPASESLAARDRLRELGRPVDLILYQDEGHGFLKMENVIDEEVRRVQFLEQATGS